MSMRPPPKRTLKTEPVRSLLKEKKGFTRYDQQLFLKSTYHLQVKAQSQVALKNIPTEEQSGGQSPESLLRKSTKSISIRKLANKTPTKHFPLIPAVVSIFNDPIRRNLTQMPEVDNDELLLERTKVLLSAKRWGVFENSTQGLLKGFKTKKEHQIASLTKIMTFYCAYVVVIKYYLIVEKLQLLVDREAQHLPGTRANLFKDELVTLHDLLYGMMLNSGNDAAHVITRNLGAMISKKNRGEYFSPYDIRSQPTKDQYLKMFICLMNSAAKELNMHQTRFYNTHGLIDNVSTVRDLARITYECMKIPLFCQIMGTKKYTGKAKFVNSLGQVETRPILFVNTNKLLQNPCYKGVKTGYSQQSGGCLVTVYEQPPSIAILVVVLGCSGKDSKFNDTDKIVEWYRQQRSKLLHQKNE